ncbi:MAG: thioredoxin domain-containing protein [Bacteroidetes bacterium]|nr:thioredoxin domain-containing protein [Bacteroidota bacterium]
MQKKTNRLAFESSPYLLQHAHNPVDWYPWGEEALQRAKKENLPILVSIGYSACHWCHVMERESFEDPEIAKLMNENFVNIKIDREERPDLDHIYMDAVQAMSGSGGWPLNVFLTSDTKPFYGGTYFPPKPIYNRVSWKELLLSITATFKSKRNEIESQAENLVAHLIQSNRIGQISNANPKDQPVNFFVPQHLDTIFEKIMKSADREMGGFGHAPKFPQTSIIQYLLHYYYYTRNEQALEQACLSLDKMIAGGIHDQLGGGFARYSTDNKWLVPHFEKMLYDNALLVSVLSEAYQLTKKPSYRKAIENAIGFIESEMTSPENGFYAALDADSEGEEGKYYVWDKVEIEAVLGEDAALFCEYYQVSENGNWEGANILYYEREMENFAKEKNIDAAKLSLLFDVCREKLLSHRFNRQRPQLDIKIILGWNALMNIALSKAYAALGNEKHRELAIANMELMLQHFKDGQSGKLFHSYDGIQAKFPAFLDDYSFLIAALIQIQEITSNSNYLLEAKELAAYSIAEFSEDSVSPFYYTQKGQKDIIVRKKEIYDGAMPSGNSVMAFNLLYLSVIFDIPDWREHTINICFALRKVIIDYPSSFAIWATLTQAITYGISEIVITGKEKSESLNFTIKEFLKTFIPNKVYQSATRDSGNSPLLDSKPVHEIAKIYLCKNYSCKQPVTEIIELERLLFADVHKILHEKSNNK